MIKTIFWLLGIYLLYKLIFDFVVPISQTTKTVRKQFKTMQQQMQDEINTQQGFASKTPEAHQQKTAPKGDADDYIDFEEVK